MCTVANKKANENVINNPKTRAKNCFIFVLYDHNK